MGLRRVSGLWLKDGKSGKYMTGSVKAEIPAGAKLLVFKNQHKKADADPDYTLHLADDDDQPNQRPASTEGNPFRERARQREAERRSPGGLHAAPIGVSTRDQPDDLAEFEQARQAAANDDFEVPF